MCVRWWLCWLVDCVYMRWGCRLILILIYVYIPPPHTIQSHHPITPSNHTNNPHQAIAKSDFTLAERCAWEADDLSGLLLLYTSLGDATGLLKLATRVRCVWCWVGYIWKGWWIVLWVCFKKKPCD
jgi:hypothetical protein